MEAMPQPIIKIEEDIPIPSSKINIIDLDNYVSTEEKITKWHSKVRNRIKTLLGMECETSLDNLMEWYVRTLNEDIFNIEVNRRFIVLLEKHIHCFYSYFKGLNWISADGYLDNMEQILAFYLDCEGRIFIREKGKQKRNKKMIRKRLLTMFKSYLLNQEDRIHHALMKMRLSLTCDEAKKFLDNVFRVVFSQKPNNQSDAAFCRAFILYQKWKRIQSPEIWSTLDEMLHQMYRREPNSIQTNNFWKEILPTNTSFIGIIAQFGESDKILCDAYFKYLKSLSIEESDVAKINSDNLPKSKFRKPDLCVDDETSQFSTLMESCAQLAENKGNCVVKTEIEIEDDDDDDCVIVSEDLIEIDPKEIVYEILDDDDLKQKKPCSGNINNKSLFRGKNEENVSFLDSIDISVNDKDTSDEKNAILIDSVISPLPKLQNLDNDSVKSREILSRKFTRKKEDAEKSMECCIVESIKISDDLKLNDFGGDSSNLHSPHSTFISNSSPNSTESTENKSKESYASPTSPDISSTCNPNVCPEQEPDEPMEVQTETESSSNNLPEAESIIDDNHTEAETGNDVEAESTIDYTTAAELQIYCFVDESADDHIDQTLDKIESAQITEAEPMTDIVEDEPTIDHIDQTLDKIESAQITEAEPMTDIVEDEPTIDHIHQSLDKIESAQITEALPMTDIVEDEPTIDHIDQTLDKIVSAQITEAEPMTDIVEEEPTIDHIDQTLDKIESAQISEAEPMTDIVEDEPTTIDHSEAEPTSDLIEEDAQMSDIVEPEFTDNDVNSETSRDCIEAEFDPESGIDYIEAESTQKESLSVIGRKIEEEYTPKNTVRSGYGSPDLVESTNNEEDCDIWKIKHIEQQVGGTIPRIKVRKVKKRKMDVVYSEKVKSNNEVHHRYDSLKGGHGLDECLVGEVEKLDVSKNVILNGILPDFDLFADHVPTKENQSRSSTPQKNTTTPCTTTTTPSPSDLKSPDYDGVDDFKVYYESNQLQDINDSTDDKGSRTTKEINIKENKNILENDQNDQNRNVLLLVPNNEHEIEKEKSPKKKKITFAKENTMYTIESNPPLNNYHTQSPSPHIPQVNPNSMTLVRINYDKSAKSTPWPSEKDTALYREEDGILWRPNDQHKFDISEEDHVSKTIGESSVVVFDEQKNREQDLTSVQEFVTSSCLCAADEECNDLVIQTIIPAAEGTNTNESAAVAAAAAEEIKEPEMINKGFCKTDTYIAEEQPQTRLPLKKRKHSVANATDADPDDDYIGPELIEEIIKRARAEENEKEDISYPAKPAISIAEIQEKLVDPQPRTFKTPAEKKEMPPPSSPVSSLPLITPVHQPPSIVTEQYNNHTYNNPTINYHMNNVPYQFFPCTNIPYFPPILLPMNTTTTFDVNMVNNQPQQQQQQQPQQQQQQQRQRQTTATHHQMPPAHPMQMPTPTPSCQETFAPIKKEKRSRKRRRRRD